jgi:hypothetical protein
MEERSDMMRLLWREGLRKNKNADRPGAQTMRLAAATAAGEGRAWRLNLAGCFCVWLPVAPRSVWSSLRHAKCV